jgi:hypothetical protein
MENERLLAGQLVIDAEGLAAGVKLCSYGQANVDAALRRLHEAADAFRKAPDSLTSHLMRCAHGSVIDALNYWK